MKSKHIFRVFNSLLFLGLISLSFIGSNCNDVLNALTGDDITGTWQLDTQGGAQYDICSTESVQFNNGTATLTCPGSSSISRSYSTSGGVLEYTQTGIRYNYSVTSGSGPSSLTLTGINVNRILKYKKTSARPNSSGANENNDNTKFLNSSELK
ncbi:MAG: hypothetical protein JSS63_07345 [Bacteroidetes bacterium]|mgnify:CR=1 FL=1|nr:hypothetical protein [Bacteroidota bacterium]